MDQEMCEKIIPHVVRIETPDGTGTGFLFAYNKTRKITAIATALHVVERANRWRQPIRLIHAGSNEELFLTYDERAIWSYPKRDAAALTFATNDSFGFPEDAFTLIEEKMRMRIGSEVGWAGYPGIVLPNLCFFRGAVSAFLESIEDKFGTYLIDGVAINGVSGGPVFWGIPGMDPQLVGILSAYIPNPVGAQTLPGLAVAQDIAPLYATINAFKTFDEAKAAEPSPASAASGEPKPTSPAPVPEKQP